MREMVKTARSKVNKVLLTSLPVGSTQFAVKSFLESLVGVRPNFLENRKRGGS